MSQRYLLTPTLHNAWTWYKRLETNTKKDFLNTLRKVPFEPNEAMLLGRKFEADVEKIAKGPSDFLQSITGVEGNADWRACVIEMALLVRSGLWQERCMGSMKACGMDFLLYGKADVIKRDRIYDIKYTGNYDIGKFSESVQHVVYMATSGIEKFTYLITDGKSVWSEDYNLTSDMLLRMYGDFAEMIDGIMADDEFREAYTTHWKALDGKPQPDVMESFRTGLTAKEVTDFLEQAKQERIKELNTDVRQFERLLYAG